MGKIERKDWIYSAIMIGLAIWGILAQSKTEKLEDKRQQAFGLVQNIQQNYYTYLPAEGQKQVDELAEVTGSTVKGN